MKILSAQLNPTIGDLAGNYQKILKALNLAREQSCDLVCFPEMAISGYPPEDLLLQDGFIDGVEQYLNKVIEQTKDLFVVIGLPRKNDKTGEKSLCNSAAIISNKKLLGFQDKWLLPTYDVFDERRYFEPGKTKEVFLCKGKKIGVMVCEDMWQHAGYVQQTRYAQDPVVVIHGLKPDLLINISASPYEFNRRDIREKVCAKAAKTLHCPVVFCCQVGGNDDLVFDGYSMYVSKDGELKQLAKGFEEELMVIDEQHFPPLKLENDPLNDMYKALVLGVHDYFHKSGFKKACLGLSGGIDSALVGCIVVDALGKDNVLGVSMPSRFTSRESREDAEALARNLGIKLIEIPIEGPFKEYLGILAPHFEHKKPDITEENLQSRIRGMILMALSNKLGYIVTCTGNKSESALGYCTLYGDTIGGLAVILDVTKTYVYQLSALVNRHHERIPRRSIEKPPSAELRPNQKDSDSLPDYAIVDHVLTGYVEDCLSPEEIAEKYKLSLEVVEDLVSRIHKAEYKRRQVPPGIRVSKKSFRIGRRYPIVQKWH